jgi:hypothetical protein
MVFAFAPLAAQTLFSAVGLLDFWDDFGLVVLLLTVYMLYNRLSYNFINNPLLALIIVAVITFALLIPYPFFKYLIFVVVVMYGFWSKIDFTGHGNVH